MQLDGTCHGRLGEARPARARVELGIGGEQLGTARRGVIGAVDVAVDVLAGEGPLGPGLAQDTVLLAKSSACATLLGERD